MSLGEVIGWAANLFLITGLVLIGRKWRHAFLLTVIGEALWTVESFRLGRSDMYCLCILFGLIALYNWYKWTHETTEDWPPQEVPFGSDRDLTPRGLRYSGGEHPRGPESLPPDLRGGPEGGGETPRGQRRPVEAEGGRQAREGEGPIRQRSGGGVT